MYLIVHVKSRSAYIALQYTRIPLKSAVRHEVIKLQHYYRHTLIFINIYIYNFIKKPKSIRTFVVYMHTHSVMSIADVVLKFGVSYSLKECNMCAQFVAN